MKKLLKLVKSGNYPILFNLKNENGGISVYEIGIAKDNGEDYVYLFHLQPCRGLITDITTWEKSVSCSLIFKERLNSAIHPSALKRKCGVWRKDEKYSINIMYDYCIAFEGVVRDLTNIEMFTSLTLVL